MLQQRCSIFLGCFSRPNFSSKIQNQTALPRYGKLELLFAVLVCQKTGIHTVSHAVCRDLHKGGAQNVSSLRCSRSFFHLRAVSPKFAQRLLLRAEFALCLRHLARRHDRRAISTVNQLTLKFSAEQQVSDDSATHHGNQVLIKCLFSRLFSKGVSVCFQQIGSFYEKEQKSHNLQNQKGRIHPWFHKLLQSQEKWVTYPVRVSLSLWWRHFAAKFLSCLSKINLLRLK